jgi:hypothetical protein
MKRRSISSVLSGLVFISGLLLLLHGCSKHDKSETSIQQNELAQAKADLKAMLAKMVRRSSFPYMKKSVHTIQIRRELPYL